MANPWFRLYSEFQDDPKIQMLSETMQRRFVMLLCSRCKLAELSDSVIAFQWRMSVSEVAATKKVFLDAGFIDAEWNVLRWDQRQFVSDKGYERVRKHRLKIADETFQKRPVKRYFPVASNTPEQIQNRGESHEA